MELKEREDIEMKVNSEIRGTLNGYQLGGSYGVLTIRPAGGQPPSRPIGRLGSDRPHRVIGVFRRKVAPLYKTKLVRWSIGLLVCWSVGWSVRPSVGPHITLKTDYVVIASRRGEGRRNWLMSKTGYVEIAPRLVTVTRSLLLLISNTNFQHRPPDF
jgi:hypothetical protein